MIYYLKKYIGGEAKLRVEGLLLIPSASSYYEAMKVLDARFGENFAVTLVFRSKIESWPKVGAKDAHGLRLFSDFLRQCKVTSSTGTSRHSTLQSQTYIQTTT